MKSYTFRECTVEMMEIFFGIEQGLQSEQLSAWLNEPTEITELEKLILLNYQKTMIANLLGWNEQELALNFIGPVISLLQFTSKKYNLFAERPMGETFQFGEDEEIKLMGRPDTFIASGHRSPKVPYFSFHEHKPETDGGGDPTGQVLAAMIVGQAKNGLFDDPIYGCYVIGQNWYFLILEGKTYTIASPFAATSTEIFDIYRALKTLKNIVAAKVGP